MRLLNVRKLSINGDNIHFATAFRKFAVDKAHIESIRVMRISSFFEEIGIELESSGRLFLITERVSGFFALAKLLHFETVFGALWYRDAEEGRELRHAFEIGT